MIKNEIYIEPADYFSPESLKIIEDWEKEHKPNKTKSEKKCTPQKSKAKKGLRGCKRYSHGKKGM